MSICQSAPTAAPVQPRPATRLRALAPGEAAPVHAVFAGMSPWSRFLRFHAPVHRLSPAMVDRLVAVHPDRHVALVASVGPADVGIGRWIREADDPGRAEVALEVVDAYHRCGIGGLLLRRLADSAAAAGVAELLLSVHPENDAMLGLLGRLGVAGRFDGYSVEAVVAPSRISASTSSATRSRSVASGRW
jgi:GNAT superfamily N-acetyltransferase